MRTFESELNRSQAYNINKGVIQTYPLDLGCAHDVAGYYHELGHMLNNDQMDGKYMSNSLRDEYEIKAWDTAFLLYMKVNNTNKVPHQFFNVRQDCLATYSISDKECKVNPKRNCAFGFKTYEN